MRPRRGRRGRRALPVSRSNSRLLGSRAAAMTGVDRFGGQRSASKVGVEDRAGQVEDASKRTVSSGSAPACATRSSSVSSSIGSVVQWRSPCARAARTSRMASVTTGLPWCAISPFHACCSATVHRRTAVPSREHPSRRICLSRVGARWDRGHRATMVAMSGTEQRTFPSASSWVLFDGSCGFCRTWVTYWAGTLYTRGFEIAPLQEDWVRERLGVSGRGRPAARLAAAARRWPTAARCRCIPICDEANLVGLPVLPRVR